MAQKQTFLISSVFHVPDTLDKFSTTDLWTVDCADFAHTRVCVCVYVCVSWKIVLHRQTIFHELMKVNA